MVKFLDFFRSRQRHDHPPFNDGTRWFLEVRAEVVKRRPELMDEFNPLLHDTPSAIARFLDRYFPIECRWGGLSFDGVRDRIRSY